MEQQQSGIARAVESAGSQAKLGATLGVSQQVISLWVKQGYVPKERAREIEQEYGVPRAELIDPKLRDLVDPGEVL